MLIDSTLLILKKHGWFTTVCGLLVEQNRHRWNTCAETGGWQKSAVVYMGRDFSSFKAHLLFAMYDNRGFIFQAWAPGTTFFYKLQVSHTCGILAITTFTLTSQFSHKRLFTQFTAQSEIAIICSL